MNEADSRPVAARTGLLFVLMTCVCLLAATPPAQAKPANQAFNVVPLTVQQVSAVNGQLMATLAVGKTTILVPVQVAAHGSGACPILDLQLAPINLTLLGLNVDTSAICLSVTAYQNGGLLGDLLCSVANLLNNGTSLADILASLSGADVTRLVNGIRDLLNGALALLTDNRHVAGATCDILHLALGPVDLTLLGLNVHLDNCAGGPITLDITATAGGGLLGDLLCDLADLLRVGPNTRAVYVTLQQIAQIIRQLVG